MKNHELDVVDRTILNILQRNAKCPLQRFGRTKTLIVFSTSVEHRGINADIEETLE